MRPVCLQCQTNPAAVNYHRNDKIYYRKLCNQCLKVEKKLSTPKNSRWQLAGYQKKAACEQCGFKPVMAGQLEVFQIDRNQQHVATANLRTVCLNCNYELSRTGWTQGDLTEDL
jgi:hypothetical protein